MDFEDEKENDCIITKSPPELFDEFIQAGDLTETINVFKKLCESLEINPKNYKTVYTSIKNGLTTWKARSLWAKLDKRTENKDYKNKPCARNKVLIIGAGPCGLRSAIESALLGAQVMVLEKRDRFSRNNVLHLWPFLITDLKNLGAKKFFGMFCAGSLDHISIKRLQLILLKVALLFGVQVHPKCGFLKLIEPKEGHGWMASVEPSSHPLNKYEFDMVIGADGRRQALKFKGKEFRGKLAIGITVNFINRNSKAEASVEEISGVAFIFNQGFFQDLKDSTGIELENIVYYKDETHYFVMCAKKQSLLNKGVIKKDLADAYELLSAKNVNHDKLLAYAREAADFSTKHQLPHLDFALNHQHKEDVAMFDFTSLYAAEYSIKIYERKGYRLLATIVGDSLLEPFWPTGSGCARGFLGCFDSAWAQRSFGMGKPPMEIITERECTFRLLAQTTPENLSKNFESYSINPDSRYPNYNKRVTKGSGLQHLYDCLEGSLDNADTIEEPMDTSKPVEPVELGVNVEMLLKWCQQQTKSYKHVHIHDMSSSWRDGLAFCAIIHRFRPDLINFDSLKPGDTETNCKLAFEIAEEQLGIPPQISAIEMATADKPDQLMIVSYVSQYYESFKNEAPVTAKAKPDKSQLSYKTKSPLSKLSILTRLSRKKEKRKSATGETETVSAKKTKHSKENEAPPPTITPVVLVPSSPIPVDMEISPKVHGEEISVAVKTVKASNRISLLAEQVFGAKENINKASNIPAASRDTSEHCFFCNRWIYLMERLSAEGHFFHRECFKCEVCLNTLRLGAYSYVPPWQAEDERAHFYCRPHYNKMLYQQLEPKKRQEEEETRSQKRQRKGKSVTVDAFPKETIDALRKAADRKNKEADFKQEISEEPKVKRKPEVDITPEDRIPSPLYVGTKAATVESPEEDKKGEKFKRNRSNSGRFRRLEARPLRRSSIASVRKSDKTVRDKGKGYVLDDGLEQIEDKGRLSPIKAATQDGHEDRPPTPSPVSKSEGKPSFDVDISTEKRNQLQRAGSADETGKRSDTPPDDKKGSKGKKALDKFHRLGTFERKRRTVRAMYPPLSQVFSPEDVGNILPGQGGDELPLEASLRNAGITLKKVDINIDDDVTPPEKVAPTRGKKESKDKSKAPSKTKDTKASRLRPTSAGKIPAQQSKPIPAKQTSPKKQTAPTKKSPTKQPSPSKHTQNKEPSNSKQPSPAKTGATKNKESSNSKQPTPTKTAAVKQISRPFSGIRAQQTNRPASAEKGKEPQRSTRTRCISTGSLVAIRAARIRGLMDNDLRPRKVSTESEKETDEGSPPESRRTLPRLPSGEEPFAPTKASTKIAKRRPTGKPHTDTKQVERDVGLHDVGLRDTADGNKMAEDLPYGPPPPKPPRTLSLNTKPPSVSQETGDEEVITSNSSEDDAVDWSNASHLKRTGARRYKGKGVSDSPDERVKLAEQAKIRAAMKQRESKRLRQAQQIQRELQELEVKQSEVEKDGIVVEKSMRALPLSKAEEQKLMMQWLKVINRKNALVRYESELVIHANSIQLEDQQGRLEQEIRELLMKEGSTDQDQVTIQLKTKELVDIVEQRNNLVELLDEDRKREQEEDRVFESMLAAKGFITSV